MESQVDVKRVQNTLLNMAKKIAEILEKHDIPYMIAFGSLLGAVRHKGFIPWDDDFDFYLFDETYDKAVAILRAELPSSMFLEDEKSEPLYFHSWAHVKDECSVVECTGFPQDGVYEHKGISIDLYRAKRMLLSQVETYLADENEKYIDRRRAKGLISDSDFFSRVERLNQQRKSADGNYVAYDEEVFSLVPIYKCHYLLEKDIFPLKKYMFEDREFWGPNKGEKILAEIYGDYMKLPPVEKRRCHYSSVNFIDF